MNTEWLVWAWPLAGWTLAAAVVRAGLRMVPRHQVWTHYRMRLGLLLALPFSLLLSRLRPDAANLLWQVTLPDFVVSAERAPAIGTSVGTGAGLGLLLLGMGCFVAWQGYRLWTAWHEIRTRRKRLEPVSNPALIRTFGELVAQAGFRRTVSIRRDPGSLVPYAFGLWKPVVVVPAQEPKADHWRELLTHELVHIRRADYLWQWFEEIQRLAFAWHPLWRRLVAEIRLYRELSCDAEVLALRAASPRAYAGMLMTYALLPDLNPRAALSMSRASTDLITRIEDLNHHPNNPIIMKKHTTRSLYLTAASMATLVLGIACTAPSRPAAEVPQPETSLTEPGEEVFLVVEKMPEPVGGMEALMAGLTYPQAAKDAGVQGRVVVQFVVDETGAVTNAQLIKGIGYGCDEAALEMVKKASFTPGVQRGRNVKVQMQLPVVFRL